MISWVIQDLEEINSENKSSYSEDANDESPKKA